MNARIQSALCLGAAITLFALPALHAENAQPSMNDGVATRQTIQDIRNVGTAMFAWYKDEMAPKKSGESKQTEAEPTSADISAVPVISREDLAKVLVPKYIASIPEKDGWGNAYEFHLNTTDPNALQVMGLRSAGKDGKFSGDVYVIGGFSPADADQDISWMDGFFARWPEAKKLTVSKADLERLPGSYANKEMGFAFKVDLLESGLRLSFTQGPAFPPTLLVPISPTRFRVEGEGLAPGLTVAFQVTGEKATALTVLQPGKPEVVMTRSK